MSTWEDFVLGLFTYAVGFVLGYVWHSTDEIDRRKREAQKQ